MDTEVFVYVDLEGITVLVGRLWSRSRGDRESASFRYDEDWLEYHDRFPLEPALTLDPAAFHTPAGKKLFGAIGDSAPDSWGRALMRRAERGRARGSGETPRTLREIDFLLMVDDEARPGALRFALEEGGPFVAMSDVSRIPPLVQLPRLLAASDQIVSERETDEDIRLLLAPGSSLGGARPKASVRDRDGTLAIAKFPHREDEIDIELWEATALTLAAEAGIRVPEWRVETVKGKSALLLKRFDRTRGTRIPYLSAMSMLGAKDNEQRSYLELVDALRRYGSAPKADMRELWRRMVFSILISNTDDHLRNHGFLYQRADGWRLSPAFDLNPVPIDIRPRILRTAIDLEDATASLELAMDVAGYFELDDDQARRVASEVGRSVTNWRSVAQSHGLSQAAVVRMASAFEHKDLELALAIET